MRLRRLVQVLVLAVFILFLAVAGWLAGGALLPPSALLQLDPLAALATALAARSLGAALVPGFAILASALLAGRAFCGWVCPLGTTVDAADKLLGPKHRRIARFPRLNTALLILILAAAALGVSLVFLAAPLPLAARFYGQGVLGPLAFLADHALAALKPLAERIGARSLAFAALRVPTYATVSFVWLFFLGFFALSFFAPRLWCARICPAGAALGLLTRRSPVRRRVSAACTACGACARTCPTGAIAPEDPSLTRAADCLLCRQCQTICPAGAVSYLPGQGEPAQAPVALPGRRAVLAAGIAGAGLALIGPLATPAAAVLRPPGARPEDAFLAMCVRCGACQTACPTNTLQALWLSAGPLGLFSPTITPHIGPCDPRCHACAAACPTGAIRSAAPEERVCMKTGTAQVVRERCLAWDKKKKCLVCDEVCPFDAVHLEPQPGNPVRVPLVDEKKCAGCGFCENHCPAVDAKGEKAIVITAKDALRLEAGSYRQAALRAGLSLTLKPKAPEGYGEPSEIPEGELPPGFSK